MISVHAHARRPNRRFEGAPILSLQKAVDVLGRDVGSAAASRRRRAIAKLAGYGLERPDFRTAISQLGVDPASIERALAEIAAPPAPGASLELLVFNLPLLVDLTADCKARAREQLTAAAPPEVSDPTRWSLDVLVPATVDQVARALDPQSWDRCSTLFTDTYLVETPTPCCSATGPVVGCTAPPGPGDPPPGPAEPVGKAYGYTPLFEHFCLDGSCSGCKGSTTDCQAQFKNLLCVKTWYDRPVPMSCLASCAESYAVDYKLARSLGGELLGNENVGVTIDHGGLSVRRARPDETTGLLGSDWSVVHGEKTLAVSSPFYSGAIDAYLPAVMDEIKGELVEMACCRVAKECWLTPW
jgi:hypothetical protein